MSEIAVLNFLYPEGHKSVDSELLACLSEEFAVKAYAPPEYFYPFSTKKASLTFDKKLVSSDGGLIGRFHVLQNMIKNKSFLSKEGLNEAIILASDPLLFPLFLHNLNLENLFMVHHRSIDEIASNSIKQRAFDSYKTQIKHLVFEDFIKQYLVDEQGIPSSKVSVIPHPINKILKAPTSNAWFASGISGSNDEGFVEQLIEIEAREGSLSRNKCRIYLKSKKAEFDNGFLRVSPSYLSNNEAQRIMESSRIMLHPFNPTYTFRTSATLLESLCNGRPSISTSYKMASEYSASYKNAVIIKDDPHSFYSAILEMWERWQKGQKATFDWQQSIMKAHSKQAIKDSLQKALGRSLG